MSGKNKLLQQRAARDRAFYDAGLTTGIQMVHDFVTMALRDQDTMGKDVFGKARLEKLFKKVKELDEYYQNAYSRHVEADAKQEEMDGVLKELYGEDLVKFAERYPFVKQYGYGKPQKGWVE